MKGRSLSSGLCKDLPGITVGKSKEILVNHA